MQHQLFVMKLRNVICALIGLIFLASCANPKPYYKTREGKKKQKYYNEIQFGGKSASEMKR
jgi:hypothetical protein